MPKIIKIKDSNGNPIDAEQIPVTQSIENWNQYILEDGSVLKMKVVVSEILRLLDRYDMAGDPIYVIKSTNVISAECPNNLKKK